MELVLTEEQRMLQRAARDFVAGRSSLKRVRGARETGGFSRELWKEMAALGWLGLLAPEEQPYMMVVLEELGRGLMPEPVLSTVLLGGGALALAGTDAQKGEHLAAIAAGERLFAVAFHEHGGRFSLDADGTRASAVDGGFALRGEKALVFGGASADWLIVSARADGNASPHATTLFLVPSAAKGVRIERQHLLDGRDAALVKLDGVRVGRDAVLGAPEDGAAILARVVDRATIGLSSEMLGSMTAAFEMTLAYLKTREQFGVPIGSFQALQHRAAKLFVELELARSAVLNAYARLEAGDSVEIARAASVAKAKCSQAFLLTTLEGIQMHGGIGMTDEHDIGLFAKRARVAEMTFGDAAWHRDRFARLSGY